VGIVQGATRARPGAPGYGVHFSRTMEVVAEDGRYPTCNIFYRRDALTEVGGFDESFRYACGEDTDLAWRVKAAGYRSRFCREAVVVHEVRPPSFRLFLKERRRFADQILLVKRHPHLRRFYYRRFFYGRSHVHALAGLIVVAAALAGVWPALLLLPAIWLDRFRHTRLVGRPGERTMTVTRLLVGDLWELVVFAYCSLRYRTLLL
ncbi:MAG: glycosyltransferase family 2 protein, partial [Candidatus Binatia bacterium]